MHRFSPFAADPGCPGLGARLGRGQREALHVLMTLAAFASMFMGNLLEGALLLAMFTVSHIGTPCCLAYRRNAK